MLSKSLQHRILNALEANVFSTSQVARKAKLSRITTTKYLSALEAKGVVQSVHVGKSIAWRTTQAKPCIAILASPTTARMVKLSLGEKYSYLIGASLHEVRRAAIVITDSVLTARAAEQPVILIGAQEEHAWTIPLLFEPLSLRVLVKKLIQEQPTHLSPVGAHLVLEHLEELEEALGIGSADELVKLTYRLLRDNGIRAQHVERVLFLVEGPLPEHTLSDLEQTFALILAHIYGKMVQPGEEITLDGLTHTVPSLSVAFSTRTEEVLEE